MDSTEYKELVIFFIYLMAIMSAGSDCNQSELEHNDLEVASHQVTRAIPLQLNVGILATKWSPRG